MNDMDGWLLLWKYCNWTAIAAIVAMLIIVGISGFTSVKIRNWPKIIRERMPACGAEDAVQWAAARRGLLRDQLPHAIDSSNYRVPPHKIHPIDFERSEIVNLPNGAIYAKCSIQGCPEFALIGRAVAQTLGEMDAQVRSDVCRTPSPLSGVQPIPARTALS